MVKVLSFDSSTTATGYALFIDGEYSQSGCIDLKEIKESSKRMQKMIKEIYLILSSIKPDIVYVETPRNNNNTDSLVKLSFIIGSIIGYCVDNQIYYEEFYPSVWRKYAKRREEKLPRKRAELKQWSLLRACELFNMDTESDDESDAALMAYGAIQKYKN